MKEKFSGKILHTLFRQTAILVLCLACIIALMPVEASAASDEETIIKGYEWHRVYDRAEMEAYENGLLKSGNQLLNDDTGWCRALIVYSGDRYFVSKVNWCSDHEVYVGQPVRPIYGINTNDDTFTTYTGLDTPYIKYAGYDGDNKCDKYYVRFSDKDKLGSTFWCMQMSWYGFAWHSAAYSEFIFPPASVSNPEASNDPRSCASSASLINSVSLKFATYYYDYFPKTLSVADIQAIIRVYDHMTYDIGWTVEVSASSCERFIAQCKEVYTGYDYSVFDRPVNGRTGGDLMANYYYDMAKRYDDNDNPEVDSGCANIFYNIPGVTDRYWDPDGSEIESTQSDTGDGHGFKIFLGKEIDIPVIVNFTVEPGEAVVWKDRYIAAGGVVVIQEGATLVIDGITFNNGAFVVDGGTLIVKGVLDSSLGGTESLVQYLGQDHYLYPGSVYVDNGGVFMVEESGCYLARVARSQLEAKNGGHIMIDGIAVVPGRVALSDATLRVSNGAFLGIGLLPVDTVNQTCYNRTWIAEHSGNFLSSLCSKNAYINKVNESSASPAGGYGTVDLHHISLIDLKCGGQCCGLHVLNNSSCISNGAIFIPGDYPVTADDGCVINALVSSNIFSTIKSMMKNW